MNNVNQKKLHVVYVLGIGILLMVVTGFWYLYGAPLSDLDKGVGHSKAKTNQKISRYQEAQ